MMPTKGDFRKAGKSEQKGCQKQHAGMPATARAMAAAKTPAAVGRTPATTGVKTTVLHVLHLE